MSTRVLPNAWPHSEEWKTVNHGLTSSSHPGTSDHILCKSVYMFGILKVVVSQNCIPCCCKWQGPQIQKRKY